MYDGLVLKCYFLGMEMYLDLFQLFADECACYRSTAHCSQSYPVPFTHHGHR